MAKLRRVAIMLDLDWPYGRHLGVFAGTQRYAQECGRWECAIDEVAHESLHAAGRSAPAYDGAIARAPLRLAEEARRCRVPLVNVWYNSPAAKKLPSVFPDFAAVGRLAAEHLLGLGLRRFTCFAAPRDRALTLEVSAFRDAVEAAGCDCQCIRIAREDGRGAAGWRRFQDAVDRAIDGWSPPVGVYVAVGDMTSRHIVNRCRSRGLRVPEDVALVAGVHEPMLCLHPEPSLTSIEVPYEEIGYRAAELLDALMDGRRAPTEPLLLPPVGLAARQSTNFLAVEDPLVAAVLQFLAANSHRRIAVPELTSVAHASRRTLERRFVAALGRTPAQEVRRLRIERAKRHLTDSSLPIKTVAHLVGFVNEQRLYEAFFHQEGLSPSQYRAARGVGRPRPARKGDRRGPAEA